MMRRHGLKVFSLLVAVLLSVFVNSDSNSSVVGLIVPVEIQNVPLGRTIVSQNAQRLQVSIRGPSFLASRAALSPPIVKLPLPSSIDREYSTPIHAVDLALPPYLQVLSIDPPEIKITLDETMVKEVPVEVGTVGTLGSHLRLESIHVEPQKVMVSGPAKELEVLERISTVPVDLRKLNGHLRTELKLKMPSLLTTASVSSATVDIQVAALRPVSELHQVKLQVRGTSATIAVEPDSVDLIVSASKALLDSLKKEDIIPYVEVKSDATLPAQIPVRVEMPPGFVLERVSPPVVSLSHKTE